MSLITCPDCGQKVSSEAAACPKCGRTIKEKQTSTGILAAIIIGAIIAFVAYRIFTRVL